MQININTDKTIERHQGLDDHVQSVVTAAVSRFSEHITRVEVHLSDENSQKSSDGGNRCLLEARVTGYQPIAVSDHSVHLHQAITGAADKLKRAIESALGRLHDKQLHATPKLVPEPDEVSE
ncbi:HPF/RaiA family ribosome-associated protein [Massilia sp. P8910]|uniref:HPF/RaiA family ribosome-associated protein n=2 Tax=Massilia TaxID=149698 RepID=A0AA49ABK3_9BURK|nr:MULTISPECIES: HPF/RaiA family ribosome-associated protein [Massilia]MCE3606019.1 HPF/RaiA family ribosome-associated protein [Massilia antarctica]MCY0916193.1 HPF/RaiA family ribosome-associated protein [Massilia sp. H27-R4]NHZ83099.1 ribosomal subunit interface protein [Massilia frigida]QPI52775.1 HPF/RaiA family ribosome-associated protein [Massilia antarctica]